MVLVGHSYGGMVVAGAANREPERLAHVIYLDALTPADGQSFFDFWSAEGRAEIEADAAASGDGWRWPMPADLGPMTMGLTEDDQRWLRARAAGQPLGTLSQPVRLANPAASALPRTYVWCTSGQDTVPDYLEWMRSDPGWRFRTLATGHWPMVSAPDELARLLLAAA